MDTKPGIISIQDPLNHHQKSMTLPTIRTTAPSFTTNFVNKHRRASSTGTTGDESCTTDEDVDIDEPDCSINGSYEHVNIVRNGMLTFDDADDSNDTSLENNCDNNEQEIESNGTINKTKMTLDLDRAHIIRNKMSQLAEKHSFNSTSLSNNASPSDTLQSEEIKLNDGLESGDKDKISWESVSTGSFESPRDFSDADKEVTLNRLQDELRSAHKELRLKDEEVSRLNRIRNDVEAELEDLTASLFQEAHTMVREANVNQAAAEKSLKESQMKVEVLTAEVAALKTLVLTSTPSCPNPHLHPQISQRGGKEELTNGGVFTKKHHRSPSHFNLKYGRESSPPDSPVREPRASSSLGVDTVENKEGFEVDPNIHKEFLSWKQNPKIDKSDPFISRVYKEDISLCLEFNNKELARKLTDAIDSGNIFIEAVSDKTKTMFPKKCALLEVPRPCCYRMKLGDQDTSYNISQICRNRIIAVCDFLNYLRYIERGLVKSSAHDVYWEMTRLRKEMVLARLGLPLSS